MTEPVRRALLSVSDKTGLIPFASKLATLGIELISTGGTAKALAAAGLPVTEVASVTKLRPPCKSWAVSRQAAARIWSISFKVARACSNSRACPVASD